MAKASMTLTDTGKGQFSMEVNFGGAGVELDPSSLSHRLVQAAAESILRWAETVTPIEPGAEPAPTPTPTKD
jgi:hypothetical protein